MKIPKLRFKEFSGEWEEKRLGEISSNIMYGLNSSATDFDGKNKYIRITDIDENTGSFKPNPLTSPSGELDDNFLVNKNDILFARTGASVGKTYHYNELDGKLYFAGFLIRFNINKADSKFVYYNTLRNRYLNWIKLTSMRTGQPGVNAEEYKSYKFNFPSLEEQEKIGNFLSSVDKKISITEEKLNLFKEYKKGMMQKIFKQEIRFKDENGNDYPKWEEKKLGELCDICTGKKDTQNKIENGRYPFFVRSQIVERIDSYSYDGEAILTAGDGVGAGKVFHYINGKFDYHQRVYKLSDFKNCLGRFIFEKFRKDFIKEVRKYNAKTSVDSVRMEMITNMLISLPCLEEQQKIANFLSSLDNKIENLSAELENLKDFKKGLLQKMFI